MAIVDGSRRCLGVTLACGLACSAAIGLVALVLGPSSTVACGEGHALDRLAQRVSGGLGAGHVDGPSANYCSVPAAGTWLASGVIVAMGLVATLVVVRRPRRSRP